MILKRIIYNILLSNLIKLLFLIVPTMPTEYRKNAILKETC
jgi:hypothetical protein